MDAILKEADDEVKFNSMGRAGGSSSNPKRGFFNRQKSDRSLGAGPSQSHRPAIMITTTIVASTSGTPCLLPPSPPPSFFRIRPDLDWRQNSLLENHWATIFRDLLILDIIKFRLRIEFWESPIQSSQPRQIAMPDPRR